MTIFDDAWDLVEDGWEVLGNGLQAIESMGKTVVVAIGDFAAALINIPHDYIGIRSLRESERNLLMTVFGHSVPADQILIASFCGPTGRPMCVSGLVFQWVVASACPPLLPLMMVGSLAIKLHSKYILCLGPNGYNDAINYRMKYITVMDPDGVARRGAQRVPGEALVHEFAHAWQGIHYVLAQQYMCDSILEQTAHTFQKDSAYYYYYKEYKQFHEYNAEQQANIVEDWYKYSRVGSPLANAQLARELQPYILHNILQGQPYTHAPLWKGTTSAASALSTGWTVAAAQAMFAEGEKMVREGRVYIAMGGHNVARGQAMVAQGEIYMRTAEKTGPVPKRSTRLLLKQAERFGGALGGFNLDPNAKVRR